jgi:hypothetical protein
MQKIINLFVKLSGAGWVWEKVDGYKTYGVAALGILSGLAGLGTELAPVLSSHDAGALWALVRSLPHDSSWLMLVGSLGALGLGHKADKVAAAVAPSASASQQ